MFEIMESLFFIRRGFLSGNHFAFRAARPVLIDSAYLSEKDKTLAALASLGCDWRETSRIIATHCHCDHVGVNRLVQDASGCAVAMHPDGRRIINERDSRAAWYEYYGQEAEFFDCTGPLGDGEEIEVGRHRFKIIHAPGHSRDTIVLYCKASKILISSDALWEYDLAVATTAIEGEDAPSVWLASLEKLSGLDVRMVFPGHGAEFSDYPGALKRARERLGRFEQSPEAIADDLLRKITVYTLLMRGQAASGTFFEDLMATEWFQTTVRDHFHGEFRAKYDEVITRLAERGVVVVEGRIIRPTVLP